MIALIIITLLLIIVGLILTCISLYGEIKLKEHRLESMQTLANVYDTEVNKLQEQVVSLEVKSEVDDLIIKDYQKALSLLN